MKKLVSIISMLGVLSGILFCNFAVAAAADSDDGILASAPIQPDFVIFSFVQIKNKVNVEYKKALFDYAKLTRAEAGNLAYVIHQSPDDSQKFAIYEHWASADARAQHLAAPYTVQFFARMKNEFLQADPVRLNYQIIDSEQ